MLRRLLLLFLEPRIDHKKANVSQSIRLKTFYIDEVSLLNRLDYKTRSSPNKATAPDLWSCRRGALARAKECYLHCVTTIQIFHEKLLFIICTNYNENTFGYISFRQSKDRCLRKAENDGEKKLGECRLA